MIETRSKVVEVDEIPIPGITSPLVVLPVPFWPGGEKPFVAQGAIADRLLQLALPQLESAKRYRITEIAVRNGAAVLADAGRLAGLLDKANLEANSRKVAKVTGIDAAEIREAAIAAKEAFDALPADAKSPAAYVPLTSLRQKAETNHVLKTLVPRFYDDDPVTIAQVQAAHQVLQPVLAAGDSETQEVLQSSAAQHLAQVAEDYSTQAKALVKELHEDTITAIHAAAVAEANSRGALQELLVVPLRSDLASLLRDPTPLLDAIGRSEATAHDILLPLKIAAFGQLHPLLEKLVGTASTVWYTPRPTTPDGLLAWGETVRPGDDPKLAHAAQFAGEVKLFGRPVVAAAAAVGLRACMDGTLDPEEEQHGMAEPIFGLHRGGEKSMVGIDDGSVTTAAWSEATVASLAKLGINVFWSEDGKITPYLELSLSTLEGREQIWAARLARVVAAFVVRQSRKLTGSVNELQRERFLKRVIREGLGAYGEMNHFSVAAHKRLTQTTREMAIRLEVAISPATERIKVIQTVKNKQYMLPAR